MSKKSAYSPSWIARSSVLVTPRPAAARCCAPSRSPSRAIGPFFTLLDLLEERGLDVGAALSRRDLRRHLEQPGTALVGVARAGEDRELLLAHDDLVQARAAAARQHPRHDVERVEVGRARRRRHVGDVDLRQARQRILDRAAALRGVRRLGQVRPLRLRLPRESSRSTSRSAPSSSSYRRRRRSTGRRCSARSRS